MKGSISAQLREAIAAHAEAGRVAFVDGTAETSYAELAGLIDGYAAAFSAWGVTRGEPVGFIASKSPTSVAAYFGAMQVGACVCFLEPLLAPEAVADQMDTVGMRRLVIDGAAFERFDVPPLKDRLLRRLDDFGLEGAFADEGLDGDDAAMMLFTSGSTGKPKGVLLLHRGLVCNAEGVRRMTGVTPDDRLLHVMPVHHTNGVNNQLIVPLLAGATVELADRFRAEETVERLRAGGISYMTGVPTMYARMLPFVRTGEVFPGLRFLRCGSAPITPALHEQIEAAFGVPLVVSYGLSEATCTSTVNPPEARRVGSIGKVLPGQDVALFDPASNAKVADGAEGEIRISGPSLMKGYLGQGVEQPIVDGWLRTGDLGRFDQDGYLSITGRIKDVIIRGGENISPALIERQLAAHPAIRDCCVVGGSHADLGEVPVAFVVMRDGARLDEEVLKEFVKSSLARIYVPAEFRALPTLPTNGVGKTDRKALKKLLEAS